MKIILTKISTLYCGPLSSPYIPIFKRFKTVWGATHENSRGLDEQTGTEAFHTSNLYFLHEVADMVQVRDDY